MSGLGIHLDFDNNCSIVSMCREGVITYIGEKVPLCIAVTKDLKKKFLIGTEAKQYGEKHPARYFYEFGKYFGKKYSDEDLKHLNRNNYYITIGNIRGHVNIRFDGDELFTVVDLLVEYVDQLIMRTKDSLKEWPNAVTLTLPDKYSEELREENANTLLTYRLRKFNIVPNFQAVRSAYELAQHKALVCELKDPVSTFGINYDGKNEYFLEVPITFTDNIVKFCVRKFNQEYECNIENDEFLLNFVKEQSKCAIDALMTCDSYTIRIPNTILQVTITRNEFEMINEDNCNKINDAVNKLSGYAPKYVVFVGTHSLMPRIRKIFLEHFEENKLLLAAAPDIVISYGAAKLADSTGANPKPIALMKYSAKLEKTIEQESDESIESGGESDGESIVVIDTNEIPSTTDNEIEKKSEAFDELSKQLEDFKERIVSIYNYLPDEIKDTAVEHLAQTTKWMADFKNEVDVHGIQRQQHHLISTMEPLIHTAMKEKESFEQLKDQTMIAFESGELEESLERCHQILDFKFLTEQEKTEWDHMRSKIECELEKTKKDDKESIIVKAQEASNQERFDEAITISTEALTQYPSDEEILYIRALAYKESKDYPNAIKDFSQVIQQNPNNANAYKHRGYCYYETELYEKTLDDLRKFINRHGEMPEAEKSLIHKSIIHIELEKAKNLLGEENYSDITKIMNRLKQDFGSVIRADHRIKEKYLMIMAQTQFYVDTLGALTTLNKLIDNNAPDRNLPALKLRAECFEAREDYESAIADLQKICEIQPTEEIQNKLKSMTKKYGLQKKQEYFKSKYNVSIM